MINTEKSMLLHEMNQAALLILRATPVITVIAFEERLRKRFPKQTAKFSDKIGSGRVEWKNLVDWVKARLTSRRLIRYFGQGEDRYIVFLEPCGSVAGDSLTYTGDAWRAIVALARLST